MCTFFNVLAIFVILIPNILATRGFDHSYFQGAVSVSSYQCLLSNGYDFGIIQAQTSNGAYNPYVDGNVRNARAAGIANVDVYVFPDINQDPVQQSKNTVGRLIAAGTLTKNMIWLDIEAPNLWNSNCNVNINFLAAMISQMQSMYKGCGLSSCIGIYSSASQWNPIMCGTTRFSNLPLWYAHYDGSPSFSDFVPFGGWGRPVMKQYQGTTGICGTSIDLDFY